MTDWTSNSEWIVMRGNQMFQMCRLCFEPIHDGPCEKSAAMIEYWNARAADADANAARCRGMAMEIANRQLSELSALRAALAQAERELTKWRNWHPDDETLSELQEQARGKSQAGYVTYIAALEQRCRDNAAALAQAQAERDAAKSVAFYAFVDGAAWWQFTANGATMFQSERHEAEAEAEKRYPYTPHPLVVMAKAERDAATARAERAEAMVSKLADAVIWMSGSDDFSDNGKAHAGWVAIRDGVLAAALAGPEGGERNGEDHA